VILEDDAVDEWLYVRQTPDSLMDLLGPAREDLLVAAPCFVTGELGQER